MDQLPRLGKRELICLLLFPYNYVVSVWRGFLFLWVFGMGYIILLWHSLCLPYNYCPIRCRSIFASALEKGDNCIQNFHLGIYRRTNGRKFCFSVSRHDFRTYVHHLKWSCIKTGPGLYLDPDLPLSWSRLASIMVRKADSKMVLIAKCHYV